MRYMLLVIFLAAAVHLPADEPQWLDELILILQEYETATEELKAGLTELNLELAKSRQALADLNTQTTDLENSFKAYKTETDETVRKMRIGLFAMGAGCVLSILFAIIF